MSAKDDEELSKFMQGQDSLGSIKLDCEVQSSGITPANATFSDDPDFFPEFKLEILRAQTRLWGNRFTLIERIILYRGSRHPTFVLAVEIRGYENTWRGSNEIRNNDELAHTVAAWQPDSFEYDPVQPDSLESLFEPDYKAAFGNLKNWIICPRAPGEEIIDVDEDRCWLLYARDPEITPIQIMAEVQKEKVEIKRLRCERESDEEGETKAYMLLRSQYRENHIEANELTDRWGLYQHQFSNCLILGLQGYDVDLSSGFLLPVGSIEHITDRMMQEARQFFQERPGAKPADYPLKFQVQGRENDFPFRDIPVRFVAGEVPEEYKTEEDVSQAQMNLLFRLDDVENFEKQYGLYRLSSDDNKASARLALEAKDTAHGAEHKRLAEFEQPVQQAGDASAGTEPHAAKRLLPCKWGTKWADIAITLISDDMVLIRTPEGHGRFTYHKLGFENRTKGDTPIAIWETLKMFCKLGDISGSKFHGYDPKLVKKISLLNKHLQKLFGIKANFTLHFKKAKGYKSEIIFRDETFEQEVTPSGYSRIPAVHSEY
jgi:hypothetical protein